MAIEDYYKPGFTVYRKSRTKNSYGAWEELLIKIQDFEGVLDKDTTTYNFSSDKETFTIDKLLFCSTSTDIEEDDVVEYVGKKYDVLSVVDPLMRENHYEVALQRSK